MAMDKKDSHPKDEYYGGYQNKAREASEVQKFGTSQLPVTNDALPAKNLQSTGG